MVLMAPPGPNANTNSSWKDDREDGSRPCAHRALPSEDDREEGGCGRCSALAVALRSADPRGDPAVASPPRRPRRPDAGRFAGPRSLPAPRAPFLSAREGPQGRLSSMPAIALPASAAARDPAARAAVPYGSLRDSRLQRPRSPLQPRSGGGVAGITRGCGDLALHEETGPPHRGGRGEDDGAGPLSSSLTALDVLTHLRAARSAPPSRGDGAPGAGGDDGAHADGPATGMSSDDDDDGEQFELELDG